MDFSSMFSMWRNVLLQPKEALTSEAAKSDVTLMDGFVPYALAAVVSAVFYFIGSMLGLSYGFSGSGGFMAALLGAIVAFVGLLVLSLVEAGILWIVAMAFGGKASYAKLYYLVSTFGVPISIITSVVSLVPCVGGLISLLLGIYMLVLLVIAMKRLYGFDTTKAAIAVVAFFVVFAIIAIVLAIVIFGVAVLGTIAALASGGV